MVEDISEVIYDFRDFSQLTNEDGEDVANTGQHLQTVVDADNSVITRVGLQVILLHHVDSGGGDRTTVATAALQEHA
jgi:hypothetical protein